MARMGTDTQNTDCGAKGRLCPDTAGLCQAKAGGSADRGKWLPLDVASDHYDRLAVASVSVFFSVDFSGVLAGCARNVVSIDL